MTLRMTDEEISEFRAAERERMAPMREAARKEAFVQGWFRGKFGNPAYQPDEVLLASLKDAEVAYADAMKHRGPA